MAINTMRALTSAGVGIADDVLEWWDAKEGRVGGVFKTSQDIGRLGAAAVGYGLQAFVPRYAGLGDTLATASTPLAVKSLTKALGVFKDAGAASRAYTARRTAPAKVAHYPSETREPEFQNVRLV